MGERNLIEDEALALPRAPADGDDADGALDELKRGDGLRVHPELAVVVAVHQPQGPGRADRSGGDACGRSIVRVRVRIRARTRAGSGGGGGVLGRRSRGGAPAESKHLHHLARLSLPPLPEKIALSFGGRIFGSFLLLGEGKGRRQRRK